MAIGFLTAGVGAGDLAPGVFLVATELSGVSVDLNAAELRYMDVRLRFPSEDWFLPEMVLLAGTYHGLPSTCVSGRIDSFTECETIPGL